MKITKASHLDHGITGAQLAHLIATFGDRDGFFIETVTLPAALGEVPCGLYGPIMGDPPIADAKTELVRRGDRPNVSRVFAELELERSRMVRTVTVIAGPHDGDACVLYTVFGGPLAPKEPGDPTIKEHELAASREFWSQHALVR